jgi:hypothetical protein
VIDRPDSELAALALARVAEAWGDPRDFTFSADAQEGAIEVKVVRKASGGPVVVDIPMNPTALDPALSPPELLTLEIRRRRARADAELAELRAAA